MIIILVPFGLVKQIGEKNMKLAERLLFLRNEHHFTQQIAAEKIGIAYRSYRRYDAGEREPDASTLWKIADFYGITIDYLVGRSEERE